MTAQSSRAIGLIGAGRAGVGLALALAQAGYSVSLHGRKKKNLSEALTLTIGDGTTPPPWLGDISVVILAVSLATLATLPRPPG